MQKFYYHAFIPNFINEDSESILGKMVEANHFALELDARNAWAHQIELLQQQLTRLEDGYIYFEFSIPRMGKRVDALLFYRGVVFVIEFKVGASKYDSQAINQVIDYALDLKNFHEGSHDRPIIPILVCTKAVHQDYALSFDTDSIADVILSNGHDLHDIISDAADKRSGYLEDSNEAWLNSSYKPTPTIIEAAQALYSDHNVKDISRSDAGAKNLSITADNIFQVIDRSRRQGRKSICFVTGVPGAGKTLAGLNISTQKLDAKSGEHAVFLSGNGPLVAVLREALARDLHAKCKAEGNPITKSDAVREVSTFIQNVHHFRDEGLRDPAPPSEHVVVFDEAQRAWNKKQASGFMARKKGVDNFDMSEPEFLISVMDRKPDWSTIICLIGGGQEINTGEAGLIEWIEAIQERFQDWDVYYSDKINLPEYTWGHDLQGKLDDLGAHGLEGLHLNTSLRSFKAEHYSDFIGAVMAGESEKAQEIYEKIPDYKIYLTRDLSIAKQWIKSQARGTERFGIVASSGARRLRPYGIDVKSTIDPAIWFLNDHTDVRSSYYLEETATEFDIQGLELDWTIVCWGADLRRQKDKWLKKAFKGTKWQSINDDFRQKYLINAYRVLLTRARQGTIIFVPPGIRDDPTCPPSYFNETYEFLTLCGIPELS